MEQTAYTVDEFCKAHRIGRATFYTLLKDGQGPRVMKVGTRTLISVEAAADWRVQMEQPDLKAACLMDSDYLTMNTAGRSERGLRACGPSMSATANTNTSRSNSTAPICSWS